MYQRSIKRVGFISPPTLFGGYILCRALGGINDAFNQLWICTEYALTYNRAIIFEMLHYSASDLSTLFDFSDYPVPVFFKDKLEELKHLKPEPPDYNYNSCEFRTAAFNKNLYYSNNLILIHHMHGGGIKSINVFIYLRLMPKYATIINNTLKRLPQQYSAIHVRNTDIKVHDMDGFMQKVKEFIERENIPIFLATDSKQTTLLFSNLYPHLIVSSSLDNIDKDCIYNSLQNVIANKDATVLFNAISDLCILANSKTLLIPECLAFWGVIISGYSTLASMLNKHKYIVAKLLELGC